MSKIYAVRKGKVPGIYITWSECRKQVVGFSGAIYKSFARMEEAEEYMQVKQEEITIELESMATTNLKSEHVNKLKYLHLAENMAVIYIDGSKRPSVNHKGSGTYCYYGGKEYVLSVSCTQKGLLKYGIEESMDVMSSPTMELLAMAETLLRLHSLKQKRFEKPFILNFVSDYIGVKEWLSGAWSTEKSYIEKIVSSCNAVIQDLLKSNVHVYCGHCNGHIGIYGNERADREAKRIEDVDTMSSLVDDLLKSA